MSVVYCPNCGRSVQGRKGDYIFCQSCGEKVYIWKKYLNPMKNDLKKKT